MNRIEITAISAVLIACAASAQAAPVNATGNVTSNVLYGSGNADGGFTGVTVGNLELALRAHVRYPDPLNEFNYDGVDTYTFANTGGQPGYSVFNFDYSVNTDVNDTDDMPDNVISDYTYLLEIDIDPTAGTSFTSFDPFGLIYDNAFGYNSTANGGGVTGYSSSSFNVGQNSENLWLASLFVPGFDPTADGSYVIRLTALSNDTSIASTSINVIVGDVSDVPLPAGLPLMLAGLGGLALLRRRKG